MLFKMFQLLGTPKTTAWPGLAELPHHSAMFPRWPAQLLTKRVKELGGCSSGIDLLQVRTDVAPGLHRLARTASSQRQLRLGGGPCWLRHTTRSTTRPTAGTVR
jgi:hypothetical protein